jgi:hypothetical protein
LAALFSFVKLSLQTRDKALDKLTISLHWRFSVALKRLQSAFKAVLKPQALSFLRAAH